VGSKVTTPRGPGKVVEIDVPREQAVVELEEGGRIRMSAEDFASCEACLGHGGDEAPKT